MPFHPLHEDIFVNNFQELKNVKLNQDTVLSISAPLIKGITVIAPPSHEQFELKVEDYVTSYVDKVKTKQQEKLPEDQEEQEAVQAAS